MNSTMTTTAMNTMKPDIERFEASEILQLLMELNGLSDERDFGLIVDKDGNFKVERYPNCTMTDDTYESADEDAVSVALDAEYREIDRGIKMQGM